MLRRSILATLALLLSVAPVFAADLVNIDGGRLALQGYDPVAFHTGNAAQLGDAKITARHRGATYHFATTANRDLFLSDPDKYAPSFGGYCAYGASKGALFPVEIETWQIVDGRLILNKNLDVKKLFDKDRRGNIEKADAKWPGLVRKHGE